ncbi:MAG: hypothetical protein J7M26_02510 [Armatimonadetes bacterium]|nr:hypothetical protein [Armatimonadota bacterium]
MGRVGHQQQLLTWIGIGIVVVFALIFVYLLFVRGQTGGLSDVNAIEYATIARNLARTGHYTSSILKPLSLAKIPRPDDHPDLIYAPLHPLWESLWIRFLPYERAVPLASGAWLFFGGLLILALGWRWFDPRVGCLAAVLYILNINMLLYAAGGAETPMLAFFLLLLMATAVAFVHHQGRRLWLAAALGAVAALLGLTKYVWAVAVIPSAVLVFLATPKEVRSRALGACLGAFVVVLLPWMVRNTLVAGDPFFSFRWLESVMHTKTYPGNTLYRTFTTDYPSWLLFAVTSPREVLDKLMRGLTMVYTQPVVAPGLYIGGLFVAAVIVALGSRAFELSRYVVYASYLMVVAVLLVLLPGERLLAPLAAPATLIGVAFFVRMLDQAVASMTAKQQRCWMATALIVLGLVHAFPAFSRLTSGRPASAVRNDATRMVSGQVASLIDGPVATDVPWPVAWYGECTTIWLPRSPDELRKMEKAIGPVKWLLLTPITNATRETERTPEWADLWMQAMRSDVSRYGFRVYKRLQGNWILFQRTTLPAR